MATEASSPGAQYVIVLFDRASSRIAAFVDGHDITAYRTAATSAAALDRLTPRDQRIRLAVLGSGLEAANHVRAFAAIRQIDQLAVFSPTAEHREAFAATVTADIDVPASASPSPEHAVAEADVVLAAARSRNERPILNASWLAQRVTIISIGSTIPSQREIDTAVVDACDLIVCDAVEEVLEQTGDMLAAEQAGLRFRDRAFSLHELMSGGLDATVRAATRSLFKSVGGGLQDIVVAELLLRKVLASGLATPLPIEFDSRR
jgi:ornithine cyclodeaminase/alanine dehydrogenase